MKSSVSYDKITIPDLNLVMLPIEPGSFMMGSPSIEKEREDDETQHQVTLTRAFWMSKTEVTQSQYESIMGNNPSNFKGANNPVEMISWDDANKFCQTLTARERSAGPLPANEEYRLPTEAEWEYCCRAGTTTVFHYGDSLSSNQANFDGDFPYGGASEGIARDKTIAVASFKPNAWGLYDMPGNIYEWCSDWYGNYPSGAQTDPTGPQSGSSRVSRGGSWSNFARSCRSAYRSEITPSNRNRSIGFRLVRAQAAKKAE
jgi:sulfatase modifying factor 1